VSGPDQTPVGAAKRLETSLIEPEEKLKSIRAEPFEKALSVAVPDSSSEPTIRRTLPVRVTSEIVTFGERAARAAFKVTGLAAAVC
jgi:hypothetical protein